MNKIRKEFLLLLVILIVFLYFIFKPSSFITFNDLKGEVEIGSVVDYRKYIDSVDGNKSKLVIDDSKVNYNKLGTYDVIFKLGDKSLTKSFKVVDTTKPKVELKTLTIRYNYPLKAKELIKNITDNTKTTISFKKNYSFNVEGKQEVTVKVEDEAGNTTEAITTITVLEQDKTAPVIKTNEISIIKDSKKDLTKLIEVSDNQDTNVKIKTHETNLDRSKLGDYKIKVEATDASNNKTTKEITVKVIEPSNQKVVYLTFDDGPSSNTNKVLKILDKYNVKATFFVTGMYPKYKSYIKKAYQQGHTIALHTYSHKYSTVYKSVESYFEDLDKVGNMVKEQIGFVPKYIRFPGGSSNVISKKYSKKIMTTLTKEVQNRGYQYFDWNVDSGDASGENVAVKKLVKNSKTTKYNHIMILMHDTDAKETTIEALPKIIKYYKNKGYTFMAIDDDTPLIQHNVNN